VFPASDAYSGLWQTLAQGRRTLTFGEGGDVVCRRAAWEQGAWAVTAATPQGVFNTRLHIAGRHNVINALAAAACALAAGAPLAAIAQGLQDFVPVKGRSRAFSLRTAGREITVVDDTYNANPDSMRAAIDVLAELPGPQLLVLGDMGEVGDQGPQFHAEAGAHARAAGIPRLFALGAQSVHAVAAYGQSQGHGGGAARHFNDMRELQDAVREALPAVGSVLVKGSRFMKMEQAVEAMAAVAAAETPPAEQQQEAHKKASEGHHGATH
ncbi:MAG TPA: cyanophycin synthetase, partial [Acidovorax sp.]|nr:cyanophycin synthetase [Acidovorax sp.]